MNRRKKETQEDTFERWAKQIAKHIVGTFSIPEANCEYRLRRFLQEAYDKGLSKGREDGLEEAVQVADIYPLDPYSAADISEEIRSLKKKPSAAEEK